MLVAYGKPMPCMGLSGAIQNFVDGGKTSRDKVMNFVSGERLKLKKSQILLRGRHEPKSYVFTLNKKNLIKK